jgi:Ca-activated chloride channel homolog
VSPLGVLGVLALPVALLCLALARHWYRGRVELRVWLGSEPHARRRSARFACACAALACTAAALGAALLAPPELGGSDLDLVLAIDVSRSMSAADAPPSRLRRAVRFAERVLAARPSLRAGLVVFAGDAFVALPLTLDHEALATHLRALDTDLISARGSDVARALRQAAGVFDRESERPRALLLLSDGEHAGDPVDRELPALRRLGVRAFGIGFGGTGGASVPAAGGAPLSDVSGREVRSARNDVLLARIAAQTGGRYLRDLEDRPDAERLLAEIAAAAPRSGEVAGGLLLAAMLAAALALALEVVLSLAPRRSDSTAPGRMRALLARLAPARAALLVALAGALLGAAGETWVERGDQQLRDGQVQAALGSFQRAQREGASGAALELRIANALHRLGESERAASFYLEALRQARPDDAELRFVANFNLGAALLALERFGAAREAFWQALGERPDDLEAKFNYEWAAERAAEQEKGQGEAQTAPDPAGQAGEGGEAAPTAPLSDEEARRWLESLQDSPRDPLRRQIDRELREREQPRSPLGGQTW